MRFAFIHAALAENDQLNVAHTCRLFEVTRQGYYAYVKRLSSPKLLEEAKLALEITKIHAESRGTYGSPRVHAELRVRRRRVAKRRVERIMRGHGLVGAKKRRTKATTRSNPEHPVADNILDRDFTATAPNQRWVTDITYIATDEGWAYLAAILDLYSRRVVGWAISASLATELPLEALDAALVKRAPLPGLLHHSDRGCQYTSADYRNALAAEGIDVSMSRRGNCWDNAVAESFFSTLKTELISGKRWRTRMQLRDAVFDYIESFYNTRRLHSSLGYRAPATAEAEFQAAA